MSKFTPGPWEVKQHRYSTENCRVLAHSRHMCDVQFKADARLIAAAPEMYELLDKLSKPLSDRETYDLYADVRTLLARIDGESDD